MPSECAVRSHSEQHPFLKEAATEQRDSQRLGLMFQTQGEAPWEAGVEWSATPLRPPFHVGSFSSLSWCPVALGHLEADPR